MAGSVNKVILVGNLGKDPEIRNAQSGSKIATFTLATSETWNDRASGERKEKTEWHRVVVFNDRIADVVERFVRKGRKVYVEGSLQTRKWTDQSGQDRYTTEVVIDRFRGELVLIDSQRGGGGDEAGESDYGNSYGARPVGGNNSDGGGYGSGRALSNASGGGNRQTGGGMGGNRGGQQGGGNQGGWEPGSSDLDDEIPF